eukprot:364247-Chlamydomonas_euryale.AAC.4
MLVGRLSVPPPPPELFPGEYECVVEPLGRSEYRWQTPMRSAGMKEQEIYRAHRGGNSVGWGRAY